MTTAPLKSALEAPPQPAPQPPAPQPVPRDDAGLHRKPALAPVFAVACFALSVAFLLYGARTFSPFSAVLLRVARYPAVVHTAAIACFFLVTCALVVELVLRRRPQRTPLYLLLNRAIGYAVIVTLAFHGLLIAKDAGALTHTRALLFDPETQIATLVLMCLACVMIYAAFLHPLPPGDEDVMPSYKDAVEALSHSYDFILGVERPDDYKRAEAGKKQWLVLPEHSLWTNLFVFGGIDSGKTSSLAYPLVLQALKKFSDDDALRPSIVLLDLKGDNALRLYEFSKALGREEELWVISPGNQLLDAEGRPILDERGAPIIPRDRFLTWNPIGGSEPADLRASLLLDGLASTNDGPKLSGSAEYFENVEAEFLSATVQLLDVTMGHGRATLLDVYLFAYDEELRAKVLRRPEVSGTTAKLYFEKRFSRMEPAQQGHLISGLTAKLAKLTSPSLKQTFCVRGGDEVRTTRAFSGFLDLVVNRPGVVVFSVPEAIYSRELARVLGIMFMRAFHAEMLRRSTTQFVKAGGNNKRLVMNVVDECWAFMNRGVASFTAVSRQARACSVFLTQSLDQIPETYRATVEGNFRTKALLSVNDSVTLRRFEELFGTQKELVMNTSVNASLSSVRHGVFRQRMTGGEQGFSETHSLSEQQRPRFSLTEIQHLPRGRAVVHLYTSAGQRPACAMEVTPWFRLPFHLLPPLAHEDVGCPKRPGAVHDFVAHTGRSGGSESATCGRCGHSVSGERYRDLVAFVEEHAARGQA